MSIKCSVKQTWTHSLQYALMWPGKQAAYRPTWRTVRLLVLVIVWADHCWPCLNGHAHTTSLQTLASFMHHGCCQPVYGTFVPRELSHLRTFLPVNFRGREPNPNPNPGTGKLSRLGTKVTLARKFRLPVTASHF